jgi:hypothetical protein
MTLRIGILGTRGIPNYYGGFEQFAEYLSTGLVNNGHEVFVYNSHNHPYKQDAWNKVQIIHCYDPEYQLGSFGQFIYDLNCILDARKRKFDVILMLGFTSSSAWGWFYPDKSTLIFNMDGLEWKRTKYSKPVQQFLMLAEKLAVRFSSYYIADSVVIQSYLQNKYAINSEHIPYGAEVYYHEDESLLQEWGVEKHNYFILMARMVSENNIEMILDGFHAAICYRNLNTTNALYSPVAFITTRKKYIPSKYSPKFTFMVIVWVAPILPCWKRWPAGH